MLCLQFVSGSQASISAGLGRCYALLFNFGPLLSNTHQFHSRSISRDRDVDRRRTCPGAGAGETCLRARHSKRRREEPGRRRRDLRPSNLLKNRLTAADRNASQTEPRQN